MDRSLEKEDEAGAASEPSTLTTAPPTPILLTLLVSIFKAWEKVFGFEARGYNPLKNETILETKLAPPSVWPSLVLGELQNCLPSSMSAPTKNRAPLPRAEPAVNPGPNSCCASFNFSLIHSLSPPLLFSHDLSREVQG